MSSDRHDFLRIHIDPTLRQYLDRLDHERDFNVADWARNALCEALEREFSPEPRIPDAVHPSSSSSPRSPRVLIRPSLTKVTAVTTLPRHFHRTSPGSSVMLALGVGTALLVVLLMQALGNWPNRYILKKPLALPQRTTVAKLGELRKTLRVSGSIQALQYAAIEAPHLGGRRDFGVGYLTLAQLVEAGKVVEAGSVVAEFELESLARHIEERQSRTAVSKAQLKRKHAEILGLEASDRQRLLHARAELDKALLSLRLTAVLSPIESEILRNSANEKRVAMEQLEQERNLKQRAHESDILGLELAVKREALHLERHRRDYAKLIVKAPISGLVVREEIFNANSEFAPVEKGDRLFPGTLFMRIVDPSHMAVRAAVNQVDALAIRSGSEATVTLDAYPSTRFSATVVASPSIASTGDDSLLLRSDTTNRYVRHFPAQILINGQDPRVLPELSASAIVQLSEVESGVILPREAIRTSTGSDAYDFVLVVSSQGHYQRRRIVVGDTNDTDAVLQSGIQPGEQVLLGDLPR